MKIQNLPAPGAPDIEIARAAIMKPILKLAENKLGIPAEALVPYGHFKAKLSLDYIESVKNNPNGKLVLVTAVTPTPAGEGKTTTSVGLNDALNKIGLNSMVCLREPSLGPCFGMKGGAAGGGRAQVLPMEDINLHFNGDFHSKEFGGIYWYLKRNNVDLKVETIAVVESENFEFEKDYEKLGNYIILIPTDMTKTY